MRLAIVLLLCACESSPVVALPGDEELTLPERARLIADVPGQMSSAAVQIDDVVIVITAREETECGGDPCAWIETRDYAGMPPECLRRARYRRGRWRLGYAHVHMPDPSRVEVSGAACDGHTFVGAGVSTDDEAAGRNAERLLRELFTGLPE